MSLEATEAFQILSLTAMEILVWHSRQLQVCCCLKIFHSIEIKTTLPHSSNPSGADGLKIIFLVLIVFSQEVIVSIQPFSAPSAVGELVKPQLFTNIPIPVRTSLFHSATYYTAAMLTITHLTSTKVSPFSAYPHSHYCFAGTAFSGSFSSFRQDSWC